MANYTSNTSDKKKKTAIIWWAVGFLGLVGLEYFYVGKIKAGLIRAIVGIFLLLVMYAMVGTEQMVPLSFLIWAIAAIPDLVRILLGTFKDNVGQPLRQ